MSTHNPLLTVAATLALAAAASAQVSSYYNFAQVVGAYTPITGGTQLGVATGTSGAASLDDNYYAVTLPFAFTFDGTPYTDIYVSTNGFLTFGTTSGGSYAPLSATTAYGGAASAFGRDLQAGYVFSCDRVTATDTLTNVSSIGPMQVGDLLTGTGIPTGTTILAINGNTIQMSANATTTGTTGYAGAVGPWAELRYETLGSAPNQVFVVQWQNFKRYGFTSLTTTQDMTLNFQIRLHEGTGEIEIVYGNCSPGATTYTTTCQVGLRGPTNAFPADINNRLNTKGVNDDWALSVPGTSNTSGMLFNNVAPANVIANGLTYLWAPQPGTPATSVSYGTGCGESFASAYQLFTTSAAASGALSNTSFTMTNVGNVYAIASSSAAYVTPSATATNLNIGDDAEVAVSLSAAMPFPGGSAASLYVCSNGFVSAATGNGTGYTPSGAAFCSMAQAVWGCWHDWNPTETGSGPVLFEEVGGIAYITWDNVESYPSTSPNPGTMQLQFEVATGNVNVVFGLLDAVGGSTFGDNYLVGYSPVGANADSGSLDFATALPIVTAPVDVLALALSASGAPVLGTTVTYTTDNIPAGASISAELISLGQVNPGLSVPGAPGCLQLVDLSLAATTILFGTPTVTTSIAIPTAPAFVGLPLYVQSASLVPGINPLNLITSNAIGSSVGNF